MKFTKCLTVAMIALLLSAFGVNDAKALNLFSVTNFVLTMDTATTGHYTFDVTNDYSANLVFFRWVETSSPGPGTDNFYGQSDFSAFSVSGGGVLTPTPTTAGDPSWGPGGGLIPGATSTGFRVDFTLATGVSVAPTLVHMTATFADFVADSQIAEAPEPATLILLGSALLGAGVLNRKKRKGEKV